MNNSNWREVKMAKLINMKFILERQIDTFNSGKELLLKLGKL